jgi:hypothetical protein
MTSSPGSVALLATLVLLGACAATEEQGTWEPLASTEYVAPDGSYRLELPEGWQRAGQTLTREGPEHQTITFNSGAVLPEGEVPVDPAVQPYLLQALQDELAAQPGTRVLALGSAQLDDLPAFRMHFVQAPSADDAASAAEPGAEGAERETLIYAAIEGSTLYALAYEAEPGAGFAQDLPVFEAVVASFRRVPADG